MGLAILWGISSDRYVTTVGVRAWAKTGESDDKRMYERHFAGADEGQDT